jgi:uncharacterized RDD family membrane protein YckC
VTTGIDPVPEEARTFQGRSAGLVTRSVAAGIDLALVAGGLIMIYLGCLAIAFLIRPRRFSVPSLPLSFDIVIACLVMTLYLAVAWHGGGRTFGCQVMGVRVVSRRGQGVGLTRAILRAIVTVAFPLGLGWVAISRRNLSVSDALLGTSVIYDWDIRPVVHAT